MRKSILIIGSSGNLGSELTPLLTQNYNVYTPNRNQFNSWLRIEKNSDSGVLPSGLSPDLILNLATYYSPKPSDLELLKMNNSIVGVAEKLSELNQVWNAPIVGISSYFQFAPKMFQPWSEYSEMKKKASDILRQSCATVQKDFTELVLHDNFGGGRKTKFLDILVDSYRSGNKLQATPGFSILNLVSILNLSQGISNVIESMLMNPTSGSTIYGIHSRRSWTLRALDQHISQITGLKSNVQWGALPYREKEVFEEWEKQNLPASWIEDDHAIESYVKKNLSLL